MESHRYDTNYDDDTPLIDIPLDELGMLCDLAPTCKHVKGTQVPAVRACFNLIFDRLRHGNNVVVEETCAPAAGTTDVNCGGEEVDSPTAVCMGDER